MISRRKALLGSVALGGAAAAIFAVSRFLPDSSATSGTFEIMRSDAAWRRLLTPAQYEVLRKHGTERAFSSPLDQEKRAGTFHCAGCELPLFSSAAKYDSRTGWPSFWKPLDGAIGTAEDRSLFMTRTEVHCRRCGGHLGHVFDDGPPPTGLRYCMNGVALKFVPSQSG